MCVQKQAETEDGQVLESQRTTFVKQLKLGKVGVALSLTFITHKHFPLSQEEIRG